MCRSYAKKDEMNAHLLGGSNGSAGYETLVSGAVLKKIVPKASARHTNRLKENKGGQQTLLRWRYRG
jgi:hypothetical protein